MTSGQPRKEVLFCVQKPCSNTCKQASFIVVQRGPPFPPKAKLDITRMGKGEKRKKNPDLLCQKSHYLPKTLKKNALYYSPFEHNCVRQTQNEVRLVLIHLTSTGLQHSSLLRTFGFSAISTYNSYLPSIFGTNALI